MASVWKHPKSRYWTACYYHSDGRRLKRSTKQTDRRKALRVAEALEASYRQRISEGTARKLINYALEELTGQPSASMSLKNHADTFLLLKQQTVKPNSISKYRQSVESFLSWMGPSRILAELSFISRNDIEAWKSTLITRLATSTANSYLRIIKEMFTDAEKRGYLNDSPAKHVEKFANLQTTRREPFTIPEVQALLKQAKDTEWEGIILFGLYTGQRLGDIISLRWNQIDIGSMEMTFQTRKTNRTISLPIAEPLQDWILSHAGDEPNGPLFPKFYRSLQKNGKTVTASGSFRRLMFEAGLCPKPTKKRIKDGRSSHRESSTKSFHSLRYTATSLLKRGGISNAVAMDIIGHQSEAVSRIYTNIDTQTKRDAISRLPDIR